MVVTVFDKDRIADYQTMVATLRAANIRAELYLGNPKHNVGQQLKYADKRNSPCAIIQGGDELNDPAGPQVIVKDLMLGAELSKLEKRPRRPSAAAGRGADENPASESWSRRCARCSRGTG